ncbi:uncharacterized protein BDW70DRAFT_134077, partial [Aspergillus foveolatus]|uniref:uncharacterized protein n=1 Tax=Aspergillus foveolatus TaxID=210207 RepID=UPI003CCDA10C
MTPIKHLPSYLLAIAVLLGSFSRITHGVYTPRWYSYQEYHSPDDGSAVARITPWIGTLIGGLLLLGTQKLRLGAAVTSLFCISIGLGMQLAAGKDVAGDTVLVAVAAGAVWGSL